MSEETSNERTAVLRRAFSEIKSLQGKVEAYERARTEPIAIVGVGCRFPGHVSDPESYWRLLVDGVNAITEIPTDRWDVDKYYDPDPNAAGNTMYTRRGGFVDRVKEFDAAFFGITPREAATLDPQQRLLLEVTWEALENGGIAPESVADSATGVFVGMCGFDYPQLLLGNKAMPIDGYMGSGGTHSAASGRLSYFLGVRGPCLSVDTACSSSLVSVHLAIQSLRSGECDMALAGGVNLLLIPETTVVFSRAKMMSPDGYCKTFDARADGYVRSEGCGMVVLKRMSDALRDGDNVVASIRGSAVNQDGRSSGLTVPNGTAQEEVLRAALRNAGVEPEQVGYVEAHGTGTALGDPIEIRALSAVLNGGREKPLIVGAVKTNLGHAEGAAGVAGLIKTALMLRHGVVPAHLHFETPSPFIDWERAGVVVPGRAMPFEAIDGRRIAGVSSFGFSGTNAHLVLEDVPPVVPAQVAGDRPAHVLALSAKTGAALAAHTERYVAHLAVTPDRFEDICFTANAGRSHFAHRVAVVARDHAEAASLLREASLLQEASRVRAGRPKIAFLFTGQGSQYAGMGRQLYESSAAFRECIDRCGVVDVLYGADTDAIHRTEHTQVCLFAIECGLTEVWRSWGVEPSFVMGHSVGEYAAAVAAGVMSIEDGLRLVARRGAMMQALPAGGGMLSIAAGVEEVETGLDIAAVNGPRSVVVSGTLREIEALRDKLLSRGIRCEQLNVSHAFHSRLLDPMLGELREAAAEVEFSAPRLPLVSNLTGEVAGAGLLSDPSYWVRHARGTVRFQGGMETLRARGCDTFIEIGPHAVLLGLGRNCLGDYAEWLPSLHRGEQDQVRMCESAAGLYRAGGTIDWKGFDSGFSRTRVVLPGYPFQRETYWAGPSVSEPEVVESVVSADSFYRDHCVSGRRLLPAAAYVGMTLRRDGDVVENLILHKPVVLEDQPCTIRLKFSGDSFQIYCLDSLHAEGRIAAGPEPVLSSSLAAIEKVRAESSGEPAPYDELALKGLELGPAFRSLVTLWRSGNEVVGEVRLPDAAGEKATILIDACLQVAGALAAFDGGPLLLPVRIDRAWVKAGSAVRAYCLASGNRVEAVDQAGRVIALVEGVHFRPGAVVARKIWEDWLYEVDWEPRDLCVARAELVVELRGQVAPLCKEFGTAAYEEVLPELEDLSLGFVARAFDGNGTIRHSQRHERLVARLREVSREARGAVVPASSRLRATAEFTMLERCGASLAGVLSGTIDPMEVLFPGGSTAMLERFYRDSPFARVSYGLVRRLFEHVAAAAAPGRMIRVLELGAGTGSATASALAALPKERTDYLFTDVSPAFAGPAEKKFAAWPGIRYGVLDIEKSPAAQGFEGEQFDVVLAANVLHATADLRATVRHARSLVAPGGMLVLVESSGRQLWVDLIFGLTEGWWKFTDTELRPEHALLSMAKWRALLASEGFEDVETVCTRGSAEAEPNQAVIVAYRSQQPEDAEVYLGAMDARTPEDSLRVCAEVLQLVQSVPSRLCLVTNAAANPASAVLQGMGKAIALERPGLRCVRVDVDSVDALEVSKGEDEIAIRKGVAYVARLNRIEGRPSAARIRFRADATYLIAGGLGELGIETARWMVDRGARNLLLLGRNLPTGLVQSALAVLGSRGAVIKTVRVDVSDAAALRDCLAEAATSMPPIRGVIHAAGVLSDGLLPQQTVESYREVFKPKVFGLWSLHELTLDLPLDFFVIYSSAASILGSPAQSNHCAANAYEDALAHYRRGLGLPALSINWGIWGEIGAAARAGAVAASERHGIGAIPTAAGLEILESLMLDTSRTQVAVMPVQWDRFLAAWPGAVPAFFNRVGRKSVGSEPCAPAEVASLAARLQAAKPAQKAALIQEHVRGIAARVIRLKDPGKIDARQPLSELGLDSLMAVELRNLLEKSTGLSLAATVLFDYPTVEALSGYLESLMLPAQAAESVEALEVPRDYAEPVAIVGMGCRFPGGVSNSEEYWRLLIDGVDAVSEVPRERWDIDEFYDPEPARPGKMYTRRGAFLKDIDRFDPHVFGIAPREAASLDPQHRLLLEVSWEALEDAGLAPDSLSATQTGVFMGIGANEYAQTGSIADDAARIDAYLTLGSTPSAAAGRISYVLGLQGPSMVVDTACSSSLVAAHLACASLRSGECDVALAGAVNLMLSPYSTIALSSLRMMAPDGRCKTFDASADGFVRGEGCGVVVLKRLSSAVRDGDRIHAVIRGSAVNQDGRSGGFTAPNGVAQRNLIARALANAGVSPAEVGYVEAHGTGTPLGDPIELQALSAVMREGRPANEPLLVGSVKTNVGHLEAAAGMAGLIKTVLVLREGWVPPHLHLDRPNPLIPWNDLCVAVPREMTAWRGGIAGVSSFGATGTNAHLVLEAAPAAVRPVTQRVDRALHVLTLSARDDGALEARRAGMIAYQSTCDFADLCYTANTGRSHFSRRMAVVARSMGEARLQLRGAVSRESNGPPRVAFLFSGQGSQYAGMARGLYKSSAAFRAIIDRASAVVGRDFFEAPPDQTEFTQPFLYAMEYGLAQMWREWGVEPSIVMGHSVGEYAAAAVAGLFSFEDGLSLIAERGRLMQSLPADGAMLAVMAPASELDVTGLSIAALNGSDSVVVSGCVEGVAKARAALEARGIRCELLRVSHAFHSALMDPMLPAFRDAAGRVQFHPCNLPLVSNVTGLVASDEELSSPEYWVRHARGTVQFHRGAKSVHKAGVDAYVEIGPHPVLLGMAKEEIGERALCLPSLRRGKDDQEQMLTSLAELYTVGVAVNWKAFDAGYSRRKVSLPTYPFQRQRYWLPEVARPALRSDAPVVTRSVTSTLLGRRLRSPEIASTVYEAEWDSELFGDHRLHGNVVAPVAAWIAMVSRACGKQIRDLVLHEPLILPEGHSTVVQTVVKPDAFQIVSLQGDEWRLHASGCFAEAVVAAGPRVRIPAIDSDAAPRYAEMAARGIELGTSFQRIGKLLQGNGEAWGLMRSAGGEITPGLIDSCLQTIGAAARAEDIGEDVLVPVAIELVRLPERADAIAACFARVERNGIGALRGEVRLINREGDEVGAFEGVQLRRMPRAAISYEVVWERLEQSVCLAGHAEPWTICAERETGAALVDELILRGCPAVRAAGGDQFAGVIRAIGEQTARLIVVTRVGSLDDSPLRGLANTIAIERPEIRCRSIETDSNSIGAIAGAIADAVLRDDSEDRIGVIGGIAHGARLRRLRSGQTMRLAARHDRTYLITGGMGALGLATARWLWSRGARHIALLGRTMQNADDGFHRFSGDVANRIDVERILAEISASMPPLAGVVHAAGVLDDGILAHQTQERFDRVMAPKAVGARNLHEATRSIALDFFVLYSSVASIFGSAGQGNYAAANSYLDALALARHAEGLPALSVNWGPWAEAGMAASNGSERRFESTVLRPLGHEAAFAALESAIAGRRPQVAIFDADWSQAQHLPALFNELTPRSANAAFRKTLENAEVSRQRGMLLSHVRETAARILGHSSGHSSQEPIPDSAKFFDLGLDSLMALEMRNSLQVSLECRMPSTLAFEFPTVAAVSGFLAGLLGLSEADAAVADSADDAALTLIENISEDEAEALLAEKLRSLGEMETVA